MAGAAAAMAAHGTTTPVAPTPVGGKKKWLQRHQEVRGKQASSD